LLFVLDTSEPVLHFLALNFGVFNESVDEVLEVADFLSWRGPFVSSFWFLRDGFGDASTPISIATFSVEIFGWLINCIKSMGSLVFGTTERLCSGLSSLLHQILSIPLEPLSLSVDPLAMLIQHAQIHGP
jgi:hypothetical protein